MNDCGNIFTLTDDLRGSGAFGGVYKATDENNKEYAIKCCEIEQTGLPNLLEASIMSSYIHPYLNNAIKIFNTDKNIHYVQDLAICDLYNYTNKQKKLPTLDTLRYWCFCISQAVACLHNEQIIHADIKGHNILLYKDNLVKLTDFTLSRKKPTPTYKFKHNVCTSTHRPLECFLGEKWDYSLDIWSLGCTFFEIAYGKLLFPYQGGLETRRKSSDPKFKSRVRQRSINSILYWASNGPLKQKLPIQPFDINFLHPSIPSRFHTDQFASFNNLLTSMLIIDPSKRASISDVLSHEFFSVFPPSTSYSTIDYPVSKISFQEYARVSTHFKFYTSNSLVINLASKLYSKCSPSIDLSERIKSATCVFIASKLILYNPIDILDYPKPIILQAELAICYDLNFRLHF